MSAHKAAVDYSITLRAVTCTPSHCVAESSDRSFSVKFSYEPDEMAYVPGEVVGYANPKTCLVDIHRRQREEGDYVPDKLKLIPEKNKWLEMP